MHLTTERADRVAVGAAVSTEQGDLRVAAARPHQGRWLVRFDGVSDREGAEALRGRVLTAEVDDDPSGALWVHEVIGRAVRERDGAERGTVVAVQANPAHDLLVLDDGTLVPVAFIVDDADPHVVVVDVPEGLFP